MLYLGMSMSDQVSLLVVKSDRLKLWTFIELSDVQGVSKKTSFCQKCHGKYYCWQWEIDMKLLEIQVKHQALLSQQVNVRAHVMNFSQIVLLFFNVVSFCPRYWFQNKVSLSDPFLQWSSTGGGVHQELSAWAPGWFCCPIFRWRRLTLQWWEEQWWVWRQGQWSASQLVGDILKSRRRRDSDCRREDITLPMSYICNPTR